VPVEPLEDRHGDRGDLGADAVTWKDRDLHRGWL
jgi:hypothetical protein